MLYIHNVVHTDFVGKFETKCVWVNAFKYDKWAESFDTELRLWLRGRIRVCEVPECELNLVSNRI